MRDAQFSVYQDRVALVLGASGFIGRWVASALSTAGARVVLARRALGGGEERPAFNGLGASVEYVDLADVNAVVELIARVSPAITFNLAGYGVDPHERDEAAAFRMNAELPAAAARAALAARRSGWRGLSFVHAGSGIEYGSADGTLTENSAGETSTVYARSKLAGTRGVTDAATESGHASAVTARLFTIYGPGELPGRLLPSLIQSARQGTPVDLTDGAQRRDFTFVLDAAEGLLRLGLLEESPSVVNVATGRMIPVREFVETASRVLSIPNDHLRFGVLPTRPDEMKATAVDVSLLRRLTGWVPATDPASGILQTRDSESSLASATDIVTVRK